MFEYLREGQGIKVGNRYAVMLGTGKFLIDGVEQEITLAGIRMVSSQDSVQVSKLVPPSISHFIDPENGELISKEEYNNALQEQSSYNGKYPNIATEIMVRENVRRFESYEKVSTPKHYRFEALKFKIEGEVVDTGSEFIESVLETGKLTYKSATTYGSEDGIFKVFTSLIAQSIASQYPDLKLSSTSGKKNSLGGEDLSMNSLVFNGKPVFGQSERVIHRKMLEEFTVHFTLADAQKAEKQVREFFTHLFERMRVNTPVSERLNLVELSDKIKDISQRVDKIDVKRNDEPNRRYVAHDLKELLLRIDTEINAEIKKAG